MKALTYHAARDIRHEAMADPRLESEREAIVQMTGCSICGSRICQLRQRRWHTRSRKFAFNHGRTASG